MMTLESGQPYSLEKIFSDEKRIIIPDLQRDYCWGDVIPTNQKATLAQNFTSSLIELYGESQGKESSSLGLLYAYDNPTGFVNVADGQQRITTIYLLLCILCRRLRESNQDATKVLSFLSLNEKKDVKEPRLSYEVRESTGYFLKNLLNHWVLNGSEPSLKNIEDFGWYRSEYDHDPSVQSMIKALTEMEGSMNGVDSSDFANYLMGGHQEEDTEAEFSGIQFVYFDVKDRDFGEKMYVIINTRGTPMEPNEHIKPLLIAKLASEKEQEEWTEKWEEWQDFFWQKRKCEETSADKGFEDFLTWYVQIKEVNQDVAIYDYFSRIVKDEEALDVLVEVEIFYAHLQTIWNENFKDEKFKTIIQQVKNDAVSPRDFTEEQRRDIILPLLSFMVKYPESRREDRLIFLRRLRKNYFNKDENRKGRIRSGRYLHWLYLLQIIQVSESRRMILDYTNFISFKNNSSEKETHDPFNWYDREERLKDDMIKENDLEYDYFSVMEDHVDFYGDITPLMQIASLVPQDTVPKDILEIEHTPPSVNKIVSVYDNYCRFEELMNVNAVSLDKSRFDISNYYRLLMVLSDCHTIENVYRCRDIHGVWLRRLGPSSDRYERNHLKNIDFFDLYHSEQCVIEASKEKIKEILSKTDDTPQILIKKWLILKTLTAQKNNRLIQDDDKAVAAYNTANDRPPNLNEEGAPLLGYALASGRGGESRITYKKEDGYLSDQIFEHLNTPLVYFDPKESSFDMLTNSDIENILQELIYSHK